MPGLNPNAHPFRPGQPWKGPAPRPGESAAPLAPATPKGSPSKPDLKISIPEKAPSSPGRASSSPKTDEEWQQLSQNLRRHQALGPRPAELERPGRPLNPMRPAGEARADAKKVEDDITRKKQTKSDMTMFFDRDVPYEPKGARAATPGEQAALRDFDARRRKYRDPETHENFSDLRNRGEFSATYDVRPKPTGGGKSMINREFNYDRGNTSHMAKGDAIPPSMRIHSHPDFTMPFPSPQDHRVAARNFANHGERNYLVTDSGKTYQFGPGKDGPEFTRLDVELKTPTEPARPSASSGSMMPPPAAREGSPKSASSTNSDEYWANFPPPKAQ